MNNCYGDKAVNNAAELEKLLGASSRKDSTSLVRP